MKNSKKYGYIKLNKGDEKSMNNYKAELMDKEIKITDIYDYIGSYDEELPAFFELINNILQSGDILYVPRLWQVGKSLVDFLKLQQKLSIRSILLIVLELPLSENLEFQYQLQKCLSMLSQKEAEQRIRRQKRAIQKSLELMRFVKLQTRVTPKIVKKIKDMKDEKKKVVEIAKEVGLSVPTIYRILSKTYNYPFFLKKESNDIS